MAASNNLTLTWAPDVTWQTAAGGTYLDLPIESITASRRLAIRIFADRVVVGEVWDNPASREVNVSVPMENRATAHISAQAVAYACGPWKSGVAFAAADQVCGGEYPSSRYSMTVTTAGTTGTTEPEWPNKHGFTLARSKAMAATAATDLGGGLVGIPVTAHGFFAGEIVNIAGTINYNGTFTLPAQSTGGVDVLVIAATYTAETFEITDTVAIAGSTVIDNGDGTVDIPCPDHGLESGQDVTIDGTTNYDGLYTLGAQADPDWLTVTATYVAEQINGGYAIDKTIVDGGVTWTFTDAVADLVVLESDSSRRIVGRVNDGHLQTSGVKFQIRNAP
jgi:hypothetical protein